MKLLMPITFALTIAIIVFSLTITFMQAPFIEQTATFKFLFWETQEYAMIIFVATAFLTGLFAGLCVAVINGFQKGKIIRELKKQIGGGKKEDSDEEFTSESEDE